MRSIGSLKQRHDLNRSLTEDFYYDNLHRLDYSKLNGVQNLDIGYDTLGMGNITSKSDVGAGIWTYETDHIHAVTAVPGFSFTYDNNGNQNTRNDEEITWTSYNYPSKIEIEHNVSSHEFFYDGFRRRWKQIYDDGASSETTIYVGGILEKRSEGSYAEYRHSTMIGTVLFSSRNISRRSSSSSMVC